MRLLTDEPPCPACGKLMELMFEFTTRPKLRCSNEECVGKSMVFPPEGWPQPVTSTLLRMWREFRS